MALYESGEDYLEAILMIRNEKGSVRSIDIANRLGYSKPSVSRAMSILKNYEFIQMNEGGLITLTESGLKIAEKIYERHNVIAAYFMQVLGVGEENAFEDACKVEHDLSEETFSAMKAKLKEFNEK